jgi:4-amino-4-deoxy-L-arabinose transferase-like glycosyltransferase
VPTEIAALAVLAVVAAPPVLGMLGTAYADVPLAFFVTVGLVALARWITEADGRLLAWAALFLGAGAMTKNEGGMFAVAAFAATIAVLVPRARRRIPQVALSAAGAFAPIVPWRIFLHVHNVHNASFDLTNAASPGYLTAHANRVSPTVQALLHQVGLTRFGLLVPLVAIALLAGLLSRQFALAAFVSGWLVMAFAAIVAIYWISPLQLSWYLNNSASRTVATLVIAAGSLAPLLVAPTWLDLAARWAARREKPEPGLDVVPLAPNAA